MVSPRRLRPFSLAMALAVVLNLTAPDHWGQAPNPLDALVNGEHSHPFEQRAQHDERAEHARHCHGDAATCSDLPLTSVGGFVALAALLSFDGGLNRTPWLHREAGSPPGWAAVPLVPPPRTHSLL